MEKAKLNRIDRAIALRVAEGNLPVAYDGWDRSDLNDVAATLNTRPNDYTRRGGMVIFEEREDG